MFSIRYEDVDRDTLFVGYRRGRGLASPGDGDAGAHTTTFCCPSLDHYATRAA